MWGWIYGIGVAIEAVGLLITARGIWATWQANANGEQFTDPLRSVARSATRKVQSLVSRRRNVTLHPIGIASEVSISSGLKVKVSSSPLDPDMAIPDAVAELDARTRRIEDRYQESDHALGERIQSVADKGDEIDARLGEVERSLPETARELRVEGLRGQALGIAVLALGLALQTLGQINM